MSDDKSSKINQNVCGLCNVNQSKYCCPRCEVFYCSLDCYKSEQHSQCSESFYKDCVNNELMLHSADDESKSKMIDILKRMHDEDNLNIDDLIEYDDSIDSDDEAEIDLQERLNGLNLDDADAVWNALTEDERNEFQALLSDGNVGSILPQWEPWWMYHRENKMVEEVEGAGKADDEAIMKCPELKVVPKFESLTTIQPSPTIKNNITNVLASYAFIARYFNGDIEATEGVICLLNICANLESNTNFEDPSMAIESVAQKCLQSELIQTDEASLDVMQMDTFHILRGPSEENNKHYSKAALSHLHQLLTKAKSLDKIKPGSANEKEKSSFTRKFPEHTKEHLPSLDISKVKKSIKKIEYYLSYIESFNIDFES